MRSRNKIGIFFVLFATLSTLAGCAATKDQVLTRSLAGVDAAEKAFVAYDHEHQSGIVSGATSREQGEKSLTEYRAQRDKVTAALVAAYGAIAVASSDGSDASIRKTIDAVTAVVAAMRELGVIPGGKP